MSDETKAEESTEPLSSTQSEAEKLEEKIEETEDKIEEAKSNPEYATKEDIASLTSMLSEFRTELAEAKKSKPVVPAPEKKEEKTEKQDDKPSDKSSTTPETKEEPKTETSYGSRRWFGGR
jgi:DNA repair exonuclease SbcCD ATPase subunit